MWHREGTRAWGPPFPIRKPTRCRREGRHGLAWHDAGEMRERQNVVSVLAEGEQSGSGSRQPQPLPFPRQNELQAAGAASLPRAAAPGAPSPAHAPRLLLTSAHRLGLGACKFLAKPGPKISGGGRRSALGEGDEIFSCGREGGCSAAGGGAVPGSSSCWPPGNSPGINLAPANLVAGLGTEAPEGARGTPGRWHGSGAGARWLRRDNKC